MDTLSLKIVDITPASSDTVLVSLEEVNNRFFPYEAGQFLTFIVHIRGREYRRSYSITSTPGIDKQTSVLIKRHINGEISRYLADHMKPGDVLTALPPAGRFVLPTSPLNRRMVFFIAAGSGISPVFSLLKKVLHEERFSRVVLIDQNHDEDSVIFANELRMLQNRYAERFKWISLLSNPKQRNTLPQRLNNNLLEQLVIANFSLPGSTPDSDVFYICGPYSFMRMAQFVLKLVGFKDDQIRKENFVADILPPPPLIADRSPKNIVLHWNKNTFHFQVSYPDTILQAALHNHIQLPYSCRGGRCSTCFVKCTAGKVKMSINEVLTARDLQAGLILTCVGYAETDLELEL